MSIKIKDFIFCDDLRTEVGNKFSVMGIYGDRVRVELPKEDIKEIRLPISILARFERLASNSKNYEFEMKIRFEEQDLAKIDGNFAFKESAIVTIPFPRMDFQFENSGKLNINFLIKEGGKVALEHLESIAIEAIAEHQAGNAREI